MKLLSKKQRMNAEMSENKQTPDSELLLQIVGYNSKAFEQLYNRYSATVYSLIKEIVSNPKLAEKILLDVFSVFLKRIEFYSTTSNNIFTWLTLLSRNIALDNLKRMKLVEDIPIYSDDYEIEFILPNLSNEIELINFDERNSYGEKFKNYKNQLSEIQNLVLSLVYFEGLNEEEIAKRLNVPSATVRQKLISIIDNLYQQHTGNAVVNNSGKEIISLIKLEPLGCLTSDDRILLKNVRENDPDFMWKELGEYQNLIALLSTTITLAPPPRELTSEINGIFIKIFQVGEVDSTAVAPESQILEKVQAPISDPISEPIKKSLLESVKENSTVPEPVSVLPAGSAMKSIPEPVNSEQPLPVAQQSEEPIVEENKKSEFKIRFRNPDPKELQELKKLSKMNLSAKLDADNSKPKQEVIFTDRNIPVRRKNIFVEKNFAAITPPEKNQQSLHEAKTTNDKISSLEAKTSEVKIINDDPLIKIDQPKSILVKDDGAVKSRLTPTSSINLKEFFRQNELGKKNTESGSKINNNDKPVEKIINKSTDTGAQESEFKLRVNEPPKEIRNTSSFIPKNEKDFSTNPELTAVEKTEVKTQTNLPPKDIGTSNPITEKAQKPLVEKPVTPDSNKTERKNLINDPSKDIEELRAAFNKTEKIIENKSNAPVEKINNKPETSKIEKPKNEVQSSDEIIKSSLEHIKPAVNKTTLKIRETSFVDKNKILSESKTKVSDSNKEASDKAEENILPAPPAKLSEALDIDEILTKIDSDKPKPEIVSKSNNYENEIVQLRKKLKRNVLVSAAIIVVLIATAGLVYLQLRDEPVSSVNNNNQTQKPISVASIITPNDLAIVTNVGETEQSLETSKPNEMTEKIPIEKIKSEPVVSLPPLKDVSPKEESTYFAIDKENSLMPNSNKETKQIAAAKTEVITPPVENKKIEEEPAFFVAVEEMPQLIGGIKGLQSKIVYPEIASRIGVEGKVIVQAIVDESGNVISTKVLKGIGSGCDEVAMDAVNSSKFKPGKQRGKTVKTQITIPITFKK